MRLDAKLSIINDTISASLGEFYNLSAEEKKQYEDAIKDLTEQAENSFNDGYNEGFADGLEQGELPEEALVISGECQYKFYNGSWDWFINHFGDKITTKDITNARYLFYGSKAEEIPFELNFIKDENRNYHNVGNVFSSCKNLKTPPKLKGVKPNSLQGLFNACSNIKEIPENYFDDWNFDYINSNKADCASMFNSCSSLRKLPKFNKLYPLSSNYTNSINYQTFGSCYVLDEVLDFPVTLSKLDNNSLSSTVSSCYRLKNFTFRTNEDGTPIVAQWQKQTLAMYYLVGYAPNDGAVTNYGISKDKKVNSADTYEALKNDNDWFTTNSYYSRYNHDSAVATINSLPDTLDYVTEKGSTNTITFKGTAGSDTDGGAINTLTEEEIAVATAKGWTVTFA